MSQVDPIMLKLTVKSPIWNCWPDFSIIFLVYHRTQSIYDQRCEIISDNQFRCWPCINVSELNMCHLMVYARVYVWLNSSHTLVSDYGHYGRLVCCFRIANYNFIYSFFAAILYTFIHSSYYYTVIINWYFYMKLFVFNVRTHKVCVYGHFMWYILKFDLDLYYLWPWPLLSLVIPCVIYI